MIFPGYVSHESFKPSFKLSWIILILNLVIYLGIAITFNAWPNAEVRQKIVEEKFKRSVFEMYVQTLDPIEKSRLRGSVDAIYSRALKDEKFWARLNTFPFRGDKVQIEEVKTVLAVFHKTYKESAQFQYGLGSFEVSPWSWLTYQFVHASLLHLFGNMLIVFLVLSFLEKFISIGWLVCVYLFSGFAGGVAFLNFDDVGSLSVVGASASASGILAFLLILKNRELMPWFFMLAPIKNGWGKIYLPVFFIFPLFLVPDFLSLLSEPGGVSSNVAVSAHIGGIFAGMSMALVYIFFGSKSASHRVFGYHDGLNELT